MNPTRTTMNGKPVYEVPAKGVINFDSGFAKKLLCDGPTFSTGTACAYSCAFCYVPAIMRKSPHLAGIEEPHEEIVIRRKGALEAMRSQLLTAKGKPKFLDDWQDQRVIYASPLVDVAANMELVRETVEACKLILELTHWHIRLLSKSNLLPEIARLLRIDPFHHERARERIIYGVSTGTFNNSLAKAFEEGTPLVSKRIESLHVLQDHGHRTFGMICPSLPQRDYRAFAQEAAAVIDAHACEHVWAEPLNVRGKSMLRTVEALQRAGFTWEANALSDVSASPAAWENYARDTFEAHAKIYMPGNRKLRFLQYVNAGNRGYWEGQRERGAVLL